MSETVKAEWNIDDTKKKYWAKIRHPFNGGFEITQKCNFRCVHCYLQNGGYKDYLSITEIKVILDKLARKGVLFLYLTGGEVLSRPDFAEIWLYAKRLGFVLEILTNGSLITEDLLKLFDEYPPATLSISVYGASEKSYQAVTQTKGQYSRVINNLKKLREHNLHFDIKFIGMRENYTDFYKIKNLAEELSVEFSHSFELFPAFGDGSDNLSHMLSVDEILNFEQSYEEARNTWEANSGESNFFSSMEERGEFIPLFACESGTTTCIVDAEGYLLPCNKLRVKKFNLLRDDFDKAWDAYAEIKKIPAPSNFKCLKCKNISVCNPCPAQNYLATGYYEVPSSTECLLAAKRNAVFKK